MTQGISFLENTLHAVNVVYQIGFIAFPTRTILIELHHKVSVMMPIIGFLKFPLFNYKFSLPRVTPNNFP